MGEILGLAEEEQLEVYRGVIDLVKSRIEKAKSFGKRKKTKKGLDIDSLVNAIVEKIGENTLRQFYKEKILSRQDLVAMKLPASKGLSKINQGLFGWRIISGSNHIDCRSEAETHYLKVWVDIGIDSIKIPKDEQYLEKITPEFEKLKSGIDQIIDNYLGSILDQKLKSQILHQVWQKIFSSQL